jgi:hypothetical protein
VIAPAVHCRIDMETDFSESPLRHQTFEKSRLAPESFTMGHDHRNEPNRTRIGDQFDQFRFGAQGDLSVSQLEIASWTEPAPEGLNLGL